MNIQSLFNKDIHRAISGVVKVQRIDDASVWQELDEYVVTPEIHGYLSDFFQAYNRIIDNPGDDIGVWVSGFFGSGKSHFIKILNYLLSNTPVQNPETGEAKTPSEFFQDKKLDAFLKADLHKATSSDTKTILFNIDSKAKPQDGRYAILNVMLREFNALQGFYDSNPSIAEIERRLTREGSYPAFEEAFKRVTGKAWKENRDSAALYGSKIIEAISEALPSVSKEDISSWYEEIKDSKGISIERFAELLKEYVENSPAKTRIIFLIDEIGQFIGQNTELMLTLQTLAEELGTKCLGKAWIVVTSQEDIDKVLGDLQKSTATDFSKIQGRFKTRLSLSSANVDKVIKHRILDKSEESLPVLKSLYTEKEAILKNLLSFSGEAKVMPFYEDAEDFALTYPFVSYQFQILQEVYTTIRQIGATGKHLASGERSMIDGFQSAAKQISQEELGVLVPFYAFYDSIENYLDGVIRKTIIRAIEDRALQPLDSNLLKLLFLIRKLEKEVAPTVDNLATLCVNHIDADKLKIKKDIEEALIRLEKQNYVRRDDNRYFFLTDEEQEIQREIARIDLDSSLSARQLSDFIFDEIFEANNKFKHFQFKQRAYNLSRTCDGYNMDRQSELNITVITPFYDNYTELKHTAAVNSAVSHEKGSAILILNEHSRFDTEFQIWHRTEKFVNQRHGTMSEAKRHIIEDLREQNRERKKRIYGLLSELIMESPIYIGGKEWKSSNTQKPGELFKQAVNYLIDNTYSKLSLIRKASTDPDADIAIILKETDISSIFEGDIPHKEATDDIRQYLERQSATGKSIYLSDLTERYSSIPYGWAEKEAVIILARLMQLGEISLLKANEGLLSKKQAIDFFVNSRQWKFVQIQRKEKVSGEVLAKVQLLAKDWFGSVAPTGEDPLFEHIQGNLTQLHESLTNYHVKVIDFRYPGKKILENGINLIEMFQGMKDAGTLFSRMLDHEKVIQEFRDEYHDIEQFHKFQTSNWDQLADIARRFKLNERYFEKLAKAKEIVKEVEDILQDASPYSKLHESSKLATLFKGIEADLTQKMQETARSSIQPQLKVLEGLGNSLKVPLEALQEAVKPLQELLESIQQSASLALIENAGLKATDIASRQAAKLRELVEPKKEAGEVEKVFVDPKAAQPLGKSLCSPEDVESYLTELRKLLLEKIKEGVVFLK